MRFNKESKYIPSSRVFSPGPNRLSPTINAGSSAPVIQFMDSPSPPSPFRNTFATFKESIKRGSSYGFNREVNYFNAMDYIEEEKKQQSSWSCGCTCLSFKASSK